MLRTDMAKRERNEDLTIAVDIRKTWHNKSVQSVHATLGPMFCSTKSFLIGVNIKIPRASSRL